MASIEHIISGESGLSARIKINLAIDEANLVANKLDSSTLNGGTIGQVLKKQSSTNLDFDWEDESTGSSYTFINSLNESAGNVNLDGDADSPGNSKYYGTNSVGTKGFFDLPSGGGVTIGSDNQIPFSNLAGDDFDYSGLFTWDGIRLGIQKSASIFIGSFSGNDTLSGTFNTAIGIQTCGALTTGKNNLTVGSYAGRSMTTSNYNTIIGDNAGLALITGDSNVFLGNTSGSYETGSNKLFIDNQSRVNEATARNESLIHGIFDSDVNEQELYINASTRSRRVYKPFQSHSASAAISLNMKAGQNHRIASLSISTTLTFDNIVTGDEGTVDITKDTNASLRNVVFAAAIPIHIINGDANSFDLTTSGQNNVFSYVCTGAAIKINYGENYG